MKPELNKNLSLTIVKIIFTISTFIFAISSILNPENWILRILTQTNVFLVMILSGIQAISVQKQKKSGYIFFGLAAGFLYVIIQTVYVGITIGAL